MNNYNFPIEIHFYILGDSLYTNVYSWTLIEMISNVYDITIDEKMSYNKYLTENMYIEVLNFLNSEKIEFNRKVEVQYIAGNPTKGTQQVMAFTSNLFVGLNFLMDLHFKDLIINTPEEFILFKKDLPKKLSEIFSKEVNMLI